MGQNHWLSHPPVTHHASSDKTACGRRADMVVDWVETWHGVTCQTCLKSKQARIVTRPPDTGLTGSFLA